MDDVIVGQDNIAKTVPLSPERLAEEEAKVVAHNANAPMIAWNNAMAGTDALPRWAEDIISGDPPAQNTLDAVAAKKALRLTKP